MDHHGHPPYLMSQRTLEEEVGTIPWAPTTKRTAYWSVRKHALTHGLGHEVSPKENPSEDSNLQRDASLPNQPTSLNNENIFGGQMPTEKAICRLGREPRLTPDPRITSCLKKPNVRQLGLQTQEISQSLV